MTVKIFCCSYVAANSNLHTHTRIQKWKNWTPPFSACFWPQPRALSPYPIKRATHTPTHTQKTYKYTLTHAQFQRCDSRWCVTRQHLKAHWQTEKEFSALCPSRSDLSLGLFNGSLRHILLLYFLLSISQPTEVPFLFLFLSTSDLN